MTEPHEWIVPAPRDVEADLVQALRGLGITAASMVWGEIIPDTVRVSRTGGQLTMQGHRDRPEILIECWHDDSIAAWEQARRCFAALRIFEETQAIGDQTAGDFNIQPPRAMDDDLAPELYRVQLTASFHYPLTDITIKEHTQ